VFEIPDVLFPRGKGKVLDIAMRYYSILLVDEVVDTDEHGPHNLDPLLKLLQHYSYFRSITLRLVLLLSI
jgi:hypothetical protein